MKNKKIKTIILITISILVVLLFVIIISLNVAKEAEESKDNNEIEDTRTEEEKNTDLINELKEVSESERIRTYLGTYFKHIEQKEYGMAYDLLYPKFKANYFPSVEDFEQYIKEQYYPDLLSIEYNEISIQGEYYIVKVKIKDFLNNSDTTAREMNLIVKENNYNDYYISFKM